MTDALTATPAGPQTDTLQEQTDLPNPQTNTIPEDDTPPAEKRSGAISKALDDVLGADDAKPKAEAKAEPKKPVDKAAPKTAELAEKDGKIQENKGNSAVDELAPKDAPKRAASYREPPAGFDDGAKADWEAVPESVRGAAHRRVQEMEQGLQKYRTEAQEYEPVRKYSEMAKQSGTTLDKALDRYVTLENKLRADPMGGLEAVVANLGLKKADGTQVTLRDVAASIMGQTPNQTATRQDAIIQQLNQQLQEVTKKLEGFSQKVEQQEHQARTQTVVGDWNSFVAQNPRAEELSEQMAEFLTKYKADDNVSVNDRLQDAYAWAVARHPSVAHTDEEPLVQTQTPISPNPAGQKSISGSPGTSDAKSAPRNLNRSAAIEKAMRAAGL